MSAKRTAARLGRRLASHIGARVKDRRGAILAFVAVSLVGLVGFGGLAIDLGRGYVNKIRLSRAVDASVIAAASALRLGQGTAQSRGIATAAVNGVVDGQNGTSFSMQFGMNAQGEQTVSATASRPMSTGLMRILGQNQLQIGSSAEAAVPPIDMSLVLDQSGSLASAGAWDDLQAAATGFVGKFSDAIDMVGLSSFYARSVDHVPVGHVFQANITSAINNMESAGWTNTGEGLRTARGQLQTASLRDRSIKVIVFFTDGRPTAIRGDFGGADRVLIVPTSLTTDNVSGYYDHGELAADPSASPSPRRCPERAQGDRTRCFVLTEDQIREMARQDGIARANEIRDEGYVLYTIGLGNLSGVGAPPPDLDYLRLLANENGIADPNQPRGRMFFAPTPADLQQVFDLVAQDIMVRLAR